MIEAQQLSYWLGQRPLIQQVSCTVQPGEVLAIVGANGAGKSTLLKLLTGALQPAEGTLSYGGTTYSDWPSGTLARRLAVLAQHTALTMAFQVSEVVMMGRYPHFRRRPTAKDHRIVEEALWKVGIQHLKNRSYLGLSGGEQQRVHLARVFAQIWEPMEAGARYLFMDEPSNNLDIRHQQAALVAARNFAASGTAVVVVLHDLNLTMQYADKVLLLKNGQVLAFGTTQHVLTPELLTPAYEFPIHLISHPDYQHPIVMPALATQAVA